MIQWIQMWIKWAGGTVVASEEWVFIPQLFLSKDACGLKRDSVHELNYTGTCDDSCR